MKPTGEQFSEAVRALFPHFIETYGGEVYRLDAHRLRG